MAPNVIVQGEVGAVPVPVTGTVTAGGISGDVAHDAVDSGNPVKVGGRASAALPPAVADNDRVNAWYNRYGVTIVGGPPVNSAHTAIATGYQQATTDGQANFGSYPVTEPNGATAAGVTNLPHLFNNATFDRQRGNVDSTVLVSAVRAATNQSADQVNYNGRCLIVVFDITAVPGVQTVTLTIQGYDVASGKYYTLLAGAAQVGVATVVMQVGQGGLVPVANLVANNIVPRLWRVSIVHSGAGNFTYSVGACTTL